MEQETQTAAQFGIPASVSRSVATQQPHVCKGNHSMRTKGAPMPSLPIRWPHHTQYTE
jgi:hypothetical protein